MALASAGVLAAATAGPCRGDRCILAPTGTIVRPDAAKVRYLVDAPDGGSSIGWLSIGPLVSDLPLEVEIDRYASGGSDRWSAGVQYLVTTEAFSDLAPTLSVGVRDILNHGEGRSGYLALTKNMGLSRLQEGVVRDLRVHGGYGSNHMGGVFLGAEARFTLGFTARVEMLNRQVNAGVSVPLGRLVSVDVDSLGGDVFVGASLHLAK